MPNKIVPEVSDTQARLAFEAWLTGRCQWYITPYGGYNIRNLPHDFFTADPGEEVDLVGQKVKKTKQK
ncbi:MAG TPA: hypothetical protein VEB42_02310 [Chitinophagaceae bacterium]|nr:hypothetical protein [Chitinophagaceae bacterium]